MRGHWGGCSWHKFLWGAEYSKTGGRDSVNAEGPRFSGRGMYLTLGAGNPHSANDPEFGKSLK